MPSPILNLERTRNDSLMRTRHFTAVLLVGLFPALAVAGSGWFNLFGWHKHADRSSPAATCRVRVETEKVEKTCFETECEQICIPRVTLPWLKRHPNGGCDSGCCDAELLCAPECGRVITVNTLKERTYECEQPVCKWTIEAGCCDECGAAGCTATGKAAAVVPHRDAGVLHKARPAGPAVLRTGIPASGPLSLR